MRTTTTSSFHRLSIAGYENTCLGSSVVIESWFSYSRRRALLLLIFAVLCQWVALLIAGNRPLWPAVNALTAVWLLAIVSLGVVLVRGRGDRLVRTALAAAMLVYLAAVAAELSRFLSGPD